MFEVAGPAWGMGLPDLDGDSMRDVIRREYADVRPEPGVQSDEEKRNAQRFTILIRAAKLMCPQGEFLCVIRDASETGVNLRLFHDLPAEERFMLELQNGDRHEVELIWQEGDRAGMRFLECAEIARIIEGPSRYAKRPVRINVNFMAELSSISGGGPVEVHDLSQQGARITSDTRFAIDQRVKLSARHMPEINAKVRWRRENAYGLVFEDTFQFGDLARILADIQLSENT